MSPFIPHNLPLENIDFQRLFPIIADASAELARYDGLLQGIPNAAVMLSPLTTQEAVLSSKIEGTQATVDEVLEQEAGLTKEGEKYKDIQEIGNYRKALYDARGYLQDYPITLSFVRQMHQTLMDSVRGKDKTPGEFRLDQNWIGKAGCTIEEATFVPPSPLQLPNYLADWQAYLAGDDDHALLQTAVMHAQFQILHPFKDGNGRIGRILIPLFLYQKKQLTEPMFYLSEYFEENREEYYQRLKAISQENDWNGWLEFFLRAIAIQAKANSLRVRQMMTFYEKMKTKVREITHSQYTLPLLDMIFSQPIFKASDMAQRLHQNHGVHKKTATNLIAQLRDAEVLTTLEEGSGRRSSTLCFPMLILICEGKLNPDLMEPENSTK